MRCGAALQAPRHQQTRKRVKQRATPWKGDCRNKFVRARDYDELEEIIYTANRQTRREDRPAILALRSLLLRTLLLVGLAAPKRRKIARCLRFQRRRVAQVSLNEEEATEAASLCDWERRGGAFDSAALLPYNRLSCWKQREPQ